MLSELECATPKPEQVFQLLCEREVAAGVDQGKTSSNTIDLTCLKIFFQRVLKFREEENFIDFGT